MTTYDPPAYERILAQASLLNPDDQLRLLEDLAALLRQGMGQEPRGRIAALRGLGREIWQCMDAQEYVRRERAEEINA